MAEPGRVRRGQRDIVYTFNSASFNRNAFEHPGIDVPDNRVQTDVVPCSGKVAADLCYRIYNIGSAYPLKNEYRVYIPQLLMCTVTFIKTSNKVYITSNRDELALRPAALAPEMYAYGSGRIIFPKDGLAGGTWMALHENGNAMVLLNGAFERHIHQPPYRLSRGLIFLAIFDSPTPVHEFEQIDLDGIEPFTLVIWQQQALWEARWDGRNKTWRALPDDVMHIWSSATLYDEAVRHKREAWFARWQASAPVISTESIEQFHEFAGDGDAATDLRMNREGLLQTVSISNITIGASGSVFRYNDLLQGGFYTRSFTW